MRTSFKVSSSRMEGEREICNTCGRDADKPYRYQTDKGERGCIASCHDKHVRHNTKPNWMAPRYVLPKWITDARGKIENFERCVIQSSNRGQAPDVVPDRQA